MPEDVLFVVKPDPRPRAHSLQFFCQRPVILSRGLSFSLCPTPVLGIKSGFPICSSSAVPLSYTPVLPLALTICSGLSELLDRRLSALNMRILLGCCLPEMTENEP